MNWLNLSLTIVEILSSLGNLVSKLSVHKKTIKVLTINPLMSLTIASHSFLLISNGHKRYYLMYVGIYVDGRRS